MITNPWLLDPVCIVCKDKAYAMEYDLIIHDCEKCKNYHTHKENDNSD